MSITEKTKLKRLNLLVDMLENHKKYFPKVKFDLGIWAENNKPDAHVTCLLDGTCKTAACAVGSAMLFPPFNRMGLKAEWASSWTSFEDGSAFEPVYKDSTGWDAVCEFFGIEREESYKLFDECNYNSKPTAKTVAKRVKKFINNGFVFKD